MHCGEPLVDDVSTEEALPRAIESDDVGSNPAPPDDIKAHVPNEPEAPRSHTINAKLIDDPSFGGIEISPKVHGSTMLWLWIVLGLVCGPPLLLVVIGNLQAPEGSFAAEHGSFGEEASYFLGRTMLLPLILPIWASILLFVGQGSPTAYGLARGFSLLYFLPALLWVGAGIGLLQDPYFADGLGLSALRNAGIETTTMFGAVAILVGVVLVLIGVFQYRLIANRQFGAYFGAVCPSCGCLRVMSNEASEYKCGKCEQEFRRGLKADNMSDWQRHRMVEPPAPPLQSGDWRCRCGADNSETTSVCPSCRRHRGAII